MTLPVFNSSFYIHNLYWPSRIATIIVCAVYLEITKGRTCRGQIIR